MADAAPDLIVVGAGGFGRETVELVKALQASGHDIHLRGICDDDPELEGIEILGVPVLGPVAAVADHPDAQLVVTIGNPSNYTSRKRIVAQLAFGPDRYATLIHPTAIVPASATVGAGSILHAYSVLTADVAVGSHVVMMPAVVLTHDDRIADFVTFGAGARLAGAVTIDEGAYIGSGASIREEVTVGAWSLVGMGSVVTRNIPPRQVWAGSPARYVRAAAPTR
jgi:sugar O-acyltransferase (sialic acid O-acetyltransferase NeuD family)